MTLVILNGYNGFYFYGKWFMVACHGTNAYSSR